MHFLPSQGLSGRNSTAKKENITGAGENGLGTFGIGAGLGTAAALIEGLDASTAAEVLANARIGFDGAKVSAAQKKYTSGLDNDKTADHEKSFFEGWQAVFTFDNSRRDDDGDNNHQKDLGDDGEEEPYDLFASSYRLSKDEAIAQLTIDRNENLQTLNDFLEIYCSWCRQHRQTPVSVDNEELQMLGVQVGKNDAGEDVVINYIANRLETRSYSLFWSVPMGVALIAGAELAISGLRRFLSGLFRSVETVSVLDTFVRLQVMQHE